MLIDGAYRARNRTAGNPNRELPTALRAAEVEIVVCGQALHDKGVADDEVLTEIPVAVSALTAITNRHAAGLGCLTIP